MKIYILGLIMVALFIGFIVYVSKTTECDRYGKIKTMDRVTKYYKPLMGQPEPNEWLYTLESEEKIRLYHLYYPEEKVCIDR